MTSRSVARGVPGRRDAMNRLLCSALNRAGEPCGCPAMVGTDPGICKMHGGKAGQTIRAAKVRLAGAADFAVAELIKVLRNERTSAENRIKAAVAVIDRCGLGPSRHVELSGTVTHGVDRDLDADIARLLAARGPAVPAPVVLEAVVYADEAEAVEDDGDGDGRPDYQRADNGDGPVAEYGHAHNAEVAPGKPETSSPVSEAESEPAEPEPVPLPLKGMGLPVRRAQG